MQEIKKLWLAGQLQEKNDAFVYGSDSLLHNDRKNKGKCLSP